MHQKEAIRQYLLSNSHLLKLSTIGRAAKIPNFTNWVHQNKDGHGVVAKLADKHVQPLLDVLGQIAMVLSIQK